MNDTKNYFSQIFTGIIKENHCSICNQKTGKCEHIKGKLYRSEICVRVISDMQLEEVSFGDNPANKHCRLISIKQNGKTINIMTLREITQ